MIALPYTIFAQKMLPPTEPMGGVFGHLSAKNTREGKRTGGHRGTGT